MIMLIVDDERMIREGIKAALPWKDIGINEVLLASSGEEALEIMKQNDVDIIITDINMPYMTGIELVRIIGEKYKEVRCIVLTGYDEFDYARDCIRAGVVEFLLKPVDEELLMNSVSKQVQTIKERKKQEHETTYSTRIYGSMQQLSLERQMLALIQNKDINENANKICELYKCEKNIEIIVGVFVPEIRWKSFKYDQLDYISIKNMIMEYIDGSKAGITFTDQEDNITVCFFIGEKSDELEKRIEVIINLIKEEYDIKSEFSLGNKVEGFENLYLSYNDARYRIEEKTVSYNRLLNKEKDRLEMYREVYSELKKQMNQAVGNTNLIIRIWDTFYSTIDAYNISDEYARRCCFEIASTLYFTYCMEVGEKNDIDLHVLSSMLLNCSRIELYNITKNFIEKLINMEEEDANEMISSIKRYIKMHLAEEINVSKLSEIFYLSPNYFSRIFKKTSREGCNEYIVRKRMEKAKILLETTNIKVVRIAADVGYKDTNYFSLTFKKNVGVSPLQYREKNRR